ncbi:hypothetical protein SAMN05660199_03382 [Klenkia soli]|uniref:Uncharacterized protein n=1 Tax=Klenkia soli TaxID=1052260 RepID=A0A1H0QWX0_9ACTN|nr:hypothetical protein [Klenkia soli]SDP21720.1 hypothetical protein SAMN05660199_03382 [Klenkia soli]
MDAGVSARPSVPLFVLAAAGVAFALALGTGAVDCGGLTMSPGDSCLVNGTEQSYGDRVSIMHNQLVGGLVVGVLAFVGAFVVGVLRRRRADPKRRMQFEAAAAERRATFTDPMTLEAYDARIAKERRKQFFLPPDAVPPV